MAHEILITIDAMRYMIDRRYDCKDFKIEKILYGYDRPVH